MSPQLRQRVPSRTFRLMVVRKAGDSSDSRSVIRALGQRKRAARATVHPDAVRTYGGAEAWRREVELLALRGAITPHGRKGASVAVESGRPKRVDERRELARRAFEELAADFRRLTRVDWSDLRVQAAVAEPWGLFQGTPERERSGRRGRPPEEAEACFTVLHASPYHWPWRAVAIAAALCGVCSRTDPIDAVAGRLRQLASRRRRRPPGDGLRF